jgi:hypothetical protein
MMQLAASSQEPACTSMQQHVFESAAFAGAVAHTDKPQAISSQRIRHLKTIKRADLLPVFTDHLQCLFW